MRCITSSDDEDEDIFHDVADYHSDTDISCSGPAEPDIATASKRVDIERTISKALAAKEIPIEQPKLASQDLDDDLKITCKPSKRDIIEVEEIKHNRNGNDNFGTKEKTVKPEGKTVKQLSIGLNSGTEQALLNESPSPSQIFIRSLRSNITQSSSPDYPSPPSPLSETESRQENVPAAPLEQKTQPTEQSFSAHRPRARQSFFSVSITSKLPQNLIKDARAGQKFPSATADRLAMIKVCRVDGSGDVEECRALIASGIKVDAQDGCLYTALHQAALNGRSQVVRALLEAGAATNLKDKYHGRTALDWARERNHAEVVSILEEAAVVSGALDGMNQNIDTLRQKDSKEKKNSKIPNRTSSQLKETKRSPEKQRKTSFLGVLSSIGASFRMKGKPKNSMTIPVHCKDKKSQDFKSVRMVQKFRSQTTQRGALWVLKISLDGKYMAVGGQEPTVRVWRLNSDDHKGEDTSSTPRDIKETESFCQDEPYRLFSGHKSDVIDLSWSESNFLLSASTDKTVRLWHVSRQRSLSVFRHPDFVTSVYFHPNEDKYFISGSFDKKLRIWNIPEHRVVEWAQASTVITAATFSPDGEMAIAGLYNGQCVLYETDGLKYFTQIDCRNRYGKHKNGRKVTGLQYSRDGKHILVTTNDSRIRLYDVEGYFLVRKFKGLTNNELQIRASFSSDEKYVICGSDEQNVFIWHSSDESNKSITGKILGKKKTKNDWQMFRASNDTVTSAQFVSLQGSSVIITTDFNGSITFFMAERIEKAINEATDFFSSTPTPRASK